MFDSATIPILGKGLLCAKYVSSEFASYELRDYLTKNLGIEAHIRILT